MEGSFSKSTLKRLPAIIQKLDPVNQKVYIYLKLRKKEEEIARLLGIPLDEVRLKVRKVREELISSGQFYLIEEPKYLSIHSTNLDTQVPQLLDKELSIDSVIIIKEFLLLLKETINELPQHQSRILRLKYSHKMSTKDILDFLKKLNINLIPGKDPKELKEQDIFYALNAALKTVLKRLKERYGGESYLCTDNLKYIFDEIEL